MSSRELLCALAESRSADHAAKARGRHEPKPGNEMRGVAASAEAPSPVSVAPIPSFGHVDPHEAIMRERCVNPQLVPSVKDRRAFQVYVGEAKDATVLDVDDVLHRGGP